MLLDRMAYGQKLWPITLHHHKTPIHTIAYLDHGRVSDVTLPLTPRGSMTRARATKGALTKLLLYTLLSILSDELSCGTHTSGGCCGCSRNDPFGALLAY